MAILGAGVVRGGETKGFPLSAIFLGMRQKGLTTASHSQNKTQTTKELCHRMSL